MYSMYTCTAQKFLSQDVFHSVVCKYCPLNFAKSKFIPSWNTKPDVFIVHSDLEMIWNTSQENKMWNGMQNVGIPWGGIHFSKSQVDNFQAGKQVGI